VLGFKAGSDSYPIEKLPPGRGGRMRRGLKLPNATCNKEVIQHMIHDDLLHHRSQDRPKGGIGRPRNRSKRIVH
jgi:hypothetical protein